VTLRGYPYLMSKPDLCAVFGVCRQTLLDRIKEESYKLLIWVDDCGTLKATRSSVERQLEAGARVGKERVAAIVERKLEAGTRAGKERVAAMMGASA
jgi:hypothetical protein